MVVVDGNSTSSFDLSLLHGQLHVKVHFWVLLWFWFNRKVAFAMDCIVGHKNSSMFSSFFSATSVISSNVSTCSYFTCCHNSNNKPMVKCYNINALILAKIVLIFSWPCVLEHPWSLLCNVIVLSLYSFTNFKILYFNWPSSIIKF